MKMRNPWFTSKLLVSPNHLAIRLNLPTIEPLKLYGEGEYNLDGIKQIVVTESYLGLDEDTRGCQNEESFEVCTTKLYKEAIIENCNCLPYNINDNKETIV